MEQNKGKPLWQKRTFLLGLFSALFIALYRSADNYTVHNLITAEDSLTAAFSYLIIGGWTGVFFTFIFSTLLGKRLIDDNFNGFVVRNKKLHINAFVSGGLASGATLFMLLGHQYGDPSTLVALASVVILYTAIYEAKTKMISFRTIAFPVLIAVCGGVLASFSGSLQLSVPAVLFVLILSNLLTAGSEIAGKKGSIACDSVNLFWWRFFWLAMIGTVTAVFVSYARGYESLLFNTVYASLQYEYVIVMTMFFVFIGDGLKEFLKKSNPITVILMIASAEVVVAFPLTIIGEMVHSGMFGVVPTNPLVWVVRILGAGLLIWSIFSIQGKTSNQSSK